MSAGAHGKIRPVRLFHLIVWVLAAGYLLADTATGFLSWQSGSHFPVSQLWKGLLLVFLFLAVALDSVSAFRWLLVFLLLLSIGPLTRFLLFADLARVAEAGVMALKVLLPMAMLLYCSTAHRSSPEGTWRWMHRVLWFSIAVLAANLIAGMLGYGFTAYGTRETAGIGIVGFFPAGNEVSAAFLVLSGFFLTKAWTAQGSRYLAASVLVVATAFLITTKAAVFGALLLTFLIPLSYQRLRFNRIRTRSMFILLFGLLILGIGIWQLWTILEVVGIADRIQWIYTQRGLGGVLFSGRDIVASKALAGISQEAELWPVLIGIGPEGLAALGTKETIEIDPLDLLLWFGIPGFLYGLAMFAFLFLISLRAWSEPRSKTGPGVLATNVVLLSVSTMAGHVLLGGMAGISLAVLNGITLVELRRIRADDPPALRQAGIPRDD